MERGVSERAIDRSGSRIAPVEGLRALAALSVLAYHVAMVTDHTMHHPVIAQLKAGVALFFVISGLVIYRPYAGSICAGNRLPDTRAFMRRRVVRIFPAYWAALTLWLLLQLLTAPSGAAFGGVSVWVTVYGLSHTYSLATFSHGLSVSWSLCVELAFYLILPFLAAGVSRLSVYARVREGWSAASVQLLVLCALAIGSFALRLSLAGSLLQPLDMTRQVLASSLPLLFDWFALGMALAVLAAEWERGTDCFTALSALAARPGYCWLAAGLLLAISVPIQGGELFLPLESAGAHLALGLAFAIAILPALAPSLPKRKSRVLAILASPSLLWLGTISYGIYLVHLPAAYVLRGLLLGVPALAPQPVPAGFATTIALLLATMAVAIGLGAASWYLIERPAQRRWTSGPHRAVPETTQRAQVEQPTLTPGYETT